MRYVGTVRYALIFDKYGTLERYAGTVRFFCNGTGTYVGSLFQLKIPDFSHIAQAFVCRGKRQLKPTLNV